METRVFGKTKAKSTIIERMQASSIILLFEDNSRKIL